MKIVVLTDIHGATDFFGYLKDDLSDTDILIFTGDITHFGGERHVKSIVDKIKKEHFQFLAVPGNCDYKEVNNYLVNNEYSLDCRFKIINKMFFMGIGGSLPCPGKTPNEYSEDEFFTFLEAVASYNIDGLPVVLVTHQPPFNSITDKLPDGFHIGSNSIRLFIEKYQPLVCFCGHVHEGVGKDYIGKTLVVNPGPFKMGNFTISKIRKNKIEAEIVNIFKR